MCLIIVNKDFKKSELIKDMKEKYYFYPDQFGLMYAKNNKLITKVIRPKSFQNCLDLFNIYKSDKNEMVLYFHKGKNNNNEGVIIFNALQTKQSEQESEKNRKCV